MSGTETVRIRRASWGGTTHRGPRPDNQDALYLPQSDTDGLLCVVCDGVGGESGGATASTLAAQTVATAFALATGGIERRLTIAIARANAAVQAESAANPTLKGMATTVAIAHLSPSYVLTVAHVGDSRIYLLRDDQLQAITHDHNFVAEQLRNGTLSEEAARAHPLRHMITRSLGTGTHAEPELQTLAAPLQPHDRVLLCSDGIHGALSDTAIRDVLRHNADPQAAAHALVQASLDTATDNVTALVLNAGTPAHTHAITQPIAKPARAKTSAAAPARRGGLVLAAIALIGAIGVGAAALGSRVQPGAPATIVNNMLNGTASPPASSIAPRATASPIPPTLTAGEATAASNAVLLATPTLLVPTAPPPATITPQPSPTTRATETITPTSSAVVIVVTPTTVAVTPTSASSSLSTEAVRLIAPPNGHSFSAGDVPAFSWNPATDLSGNEMYRLSVQHAQGEDVICTRATRAIGRSYLADLKATRWSVSIVRVAAPVTDGSACNGTLLNTVSEGRTLQVITTIQPAPPVPPAATPPEKVVATAAPPIIVPTGPAGCQIMPDGTCQRR